VSSCLPRDDTSRLTHTESTSLCREHGNMLYKCVICCAVPSSSSEKRQAYAHIVCSQCIDRTGQKPSGLRRRAGVLVKNLRVLSPLDLYLHGGHQSRARCTTWLSALSFEVLTTKLSNKLEGVAEAAQHNSLWLRTYTGGRVFMDQANNSC
jgi:DNA-directed RNA polymerase subunit RPC12/RpoP